MRGHQPVLNFLPENRVGQAEVWKCRSMLANSRWSDACWASKSSSGIPGAWNIVKL